MPQYRLRFAFLMAAIAVGMLLAAGTASAQPATDVTFSKDVASILYEKCARCHREGEIAPMSLLTYAETRPWARAIKQKVLSREMPPWHADPQFGAFQNDLRLTQTEIDTIAAWVDGGSAEGHAADLPPQPVFHDGWAIGTPDVVFSMPEPFQVPADGTVPYQHFVIPTNFTEDKWIARVQAIPGNASILHHIVVYVREPEPDNEYPGVLIKGSYRPAQDGATPRQQRLLPGSVLVATGVGTEPAQYEDGSAMLVRAGAELIMEIHYTTKGTPDTDQSRIGIVFAEDQPEFHVRTIPVWNTRFRIPAGEANYEVVSEAEFTEDVVLWTLFPHMHMRGKSFEFRLFYPDGREEVLLSVPNYDFNWQRDYFLEEPIKVPKGSRLVCTAYFDNSSANRFNPDPDAGVSWGEQTWEEMMIGFTTYSVDPSAGRSTGQ